MQCYLLLSKLSRRSKGWEWLARLIFKWLDVGTTQRSRHDKRTFATQMGTWLKVTVTYILVWLAYQWTVLSATGIRFIQVNYYTWLLEGNPRIQKCFVEHALFMSDFEFLALLVLFCISVAGCAFLNCWIEERREAARSSSKQVWFLRRHGG